MTFQEYLERTRELAQEEAEILDEMSQKEVWSKVEIRAVKNSMWVTSFLMSDINYSEVHLRRIENFFLT